MKQLDIQISGTIQSSNFPFWRESLLKDINSVNLTLITDQDFAAATEDVKQLKNAEKAIQTAKIQAIEQTEEIQRLFEALDEIADRTRQTRLTLDRQIRAKKQTIKQDLLEKAMKEVQGHIDDKPDIFRRQQMNAYLHPYRFESAIKGKCTIHTAAKALEALVAELKKSINRACEAVLANAEILTGIPDNDKLLFQDIDTLVTLPKNELLLTIENRRAKFSEQKALKYAASVDSELQAIEKETLHGTLDQEQHHYVLSIEMFCARNQAVNLAQQLKNSAENVDFHLDMKLTKRHDL